MSGLIAGDDGRVESERVALANGQTVSMQLLQQVYKEATGKTEKITRQFKVNHKTDFNDLENLNAKIEQLLEQYHVKERVCTVTFFHSDDCSERFSSFDRSRAYEVGSSSPIENVRLEYDFLIVLPVINKPQSFKITIDVHSRAALMEKLCDGTQIQRRIATAFSSSTGVASIEYVDYAVARTMMVAISQWFDALEAVPTSWLLKKSKGLSHNFGWVFKYLTATTIALLFVSRVGDRSLAMDAGNLKFGIVAFAAIFVFSGVAYQLGSIAESAVDEFEPRSFLNLNKGDRRVIAKLDASNRWNFAKLIISACVAIALNIIASWLAMKMGIAP